MEFSLYSSMAIYSTVRRAGLSSFPCFPRLPRSTQFFLRRVTLQVSDLIPPTVVLSLGLSLTNLALR